MAGKNAVGSMNVELGLNSAQFDAGIKKAQASVKSFGNLSIGSGIKNALGEIGDGFKQSADRAGVFGTALSGMGVAGIAAAAALGGIAVAIKGALDRADDFGKMSQRVGVAVEDLSRLSYAADLSDVSMETLSKGLRRLSDGMTDMAGGGSGPAAESLRALGISATNAAGQLKSPSEVMEEIAGKFGSMEDGAAKTTLAMDIFGKSGADLIPLLNSGSEGLAAMNAEADALGLTIDTQTAKAAESFNDNLTRLGTVSSGITNQLAAALAPTLATVADMFVGAAKDTQLMDQVSTVLTVTLKGLVTAGVIVGAAFKVLGSQISTVAGAISKAAQGDFGGAVDVMKAGSADIVATVKKAVADVVKVWAGTGSTIASSAPKLSDQIAAPVVQAGKKATAATKAKAKDVEDAEKKLAADLERLRESLLTKEERAAKEQAAALATIDEAFRKNMITAQERHDMIERATIGEIIERDIDRVVGAFKKVPTYSAQAGASILDRMKTSAEAIDDVSWSVEGLIDAFANGNWTSNLSGLVRAIQTVTEAWKENKAQALAAVGVAVGNAIGGKAGGFISGAASGAALGTSIAPGIGTAIGAVVGGIAGLFGASKAKKQAKEEEARRKAEEEARRAAQLAADKRALEIQIMELTGDTLGALAARRADELAAADDSLDPLLERIYALEDEQRAAEEAARAAEEAAKAAAELAAEQERLADAARQVAKTWSEDLSAIFGGRKQSWQDIASAARADRLASERADAEATKAAAEEAATAWSEFLAQVDAAQPALLKAGDAIAALAGEMSKVQLDTGRFTNRDGSFNHALYNIEYATEQAKAAQRLANMASSMSLAVENVGGLLSDLRGMVGDGRYAILGAQAIQNQLRTVAGFVGAGYSNAIRDAVSPLAQAMGLEGVRQRYQAGDTGLAGVRFAQENLGFVSERGLYGVGRDVDAYTESLSRLKGQLQAGSLSFGDFTRAVQGLDEIMGGAIIYVGDTAAQMERIAAATEALGQAGLSSIAQGFEQIGDAADALAAAAKEASTPLAQVTATIGRLTSWAQVFGESAQAAVQGGQGGQGSVATAAIIAEAAAVLAGVVTTQQAKAIADQLAANPVFAGADLRSMAFLLDGLSAFDPVGLEAAFTRISDALVDGAINQDQFNALVNKSIGVFRDLDGALERTREAAKSVADQLLVSDLSPLAPGAKLSELQRQFNDVIGKARLGDAGAISGLSGAAQALLQGGMKGLSTGADYDGLFARTMAQLRSIEQLPAVDYTAETAMNTSTLVEEVRSLKAEVAGMRGEQKMLGEVQAVAQRDIAKWDRIRTVRLIQGGD